MASRVVDTTNETIKRLNIQAGEKERLFSVPERYMTRLQNGNNNPLPSEGLGKLYQPRSLTHRKRQEWNKKEEPGQIKSWLEGLPKRILCVYSDGSPKGPGHSAYGYAIFKDKELVASGRKSLPRAEAYDAEVTAASRSLEVALEI